MCILLDILLNEFIHVNTCVMRDTLEGFHIFLVIHFQVVDTLDEGPLFHNPLRQFVVVGVNPRSLFLLGREVKTADGTDRAANRCDSLKLMRCV